MKNEDEKEEGKIGKKRLIQGSKVGKRMHGDRRKRKEIEEDWEKGKECGADDW